MPTSNMSLNEPTVGQTTGPAWATETNSNWESIDAHDHTSGKGVQLTPSSLNINANLEFNLNSATELKNVVLDNTVHSSGDGDTNVSLYAYDGNLYYRNASGVKVQITSGSAVDTTGGSISGMTSASQVLFSSNSFAFKFDKALSDPGMAKVSFADIDLYKYDASGSAAKVALKFLGSGTSAALTVPDETGTLLSTATNFAGTINIATSSSNAPIILKPHGTGHVTIGNEGATGKLTSNGAYDLILDTNGGTNSGNITITDGVDGDITLAPNGNGLIQISNETVIAVNKSLIFGSTGGSAEKITGDNTDITINSGNDINLHAGADINLLANTGLTFGNDGEKIEGDGTDLTIASSGEINVNSGTLDLSAQTVDVTLNAAVDSLNFDSNTLSIDASNNRIGIGTAAPGALLNLALAGEPKVLLNGYHASAGYSPAVTFERSKAGTLGDNTAVVDGDYLGAMLFRGANGSGYNTGAEIRVVATQTHSAAGSGSAGTKMDFFTVNNSTTTKVKRLTIREDGNVGIGTDTPNYLSASGTTVSIVGSSQTGVIELVNTSTGGTSSLGSVEFLNLAGGSAVESRALITASRDGADDATNMRFFTEPTGGSVSERMRIISGGQVRILCTSMSANPSDSNGGVMIGNTSSGSSFYGFGTGTETHMIFGNTNNVCGTIQTSGSNCSFNDVSDYRLKENVTPLTGAIERINGLKPSRYNFIANPEQTRDGFLAHEVSAFVPESVTGKFDAMKTEEYIKIPAVLDDQGNEINPAVIDTKSVIDPQQIDLSKLIPLVVASIQELSAKITALEGA